MNNDTRSLSTQQDQIPSDQAWSTVSCPIHLDVVSESKSTPPLLVEKGLTKPDTFLSDPVDPPPILHIDPASLSKLRKLPTISSHHSHKNIKEIEKVIEEEEKTQGFDAFKVEEQKELSILPEVDLATEYHRQTAEQLSGVLKMKAEHIQKICPECLQLLMLHVGENQAYNSSVPSSSMPKPEYQRVDRGRSIYPPRRASEDEKQPYSSFLDRYEYKPTQTIRNNGHARQTSLLDYVQPSYMQSRDFYNPHYDPEESWPSYRHNSRVTDAWSDDDDNNEERRDLYDTDTRNTRGEYREEWGYKDNELDYKDSELGYKSLGDTTGIEVVEEEDDDVNMVKGAKYT